MMKKSKRKLQALLCAILLSILFGGICGGSAEAKEDISWLKSASKKEVLYTDPSLKKAIYNQWTVCLYPLSKNISAKRVTNVKSSNSKVVKIVGKPYNKKAGKKKAVVLDLRAEKPGKATVSFKYKSKTYKIKCVVKKYSNGLKSFKLGGIADDFAPKFNSGTMYDYDKEVDNNPTNLKVKTKKNWVITSISIYADEEIYGEKVFSNSKGKSSVTVKESRLKFSSMMSIEVDCKNKKTGEEEEYWITLNKPID